MATEYRANRRVPTSGLMGNLDGLEHVLKIVLCRCADRQTSATASKDFNVSAREECAQKGLDSSELALHLEWPERVVRRWLLDPNDPDYKAMSERDYQHFLFCLSQLPASSDEINNKSGQT